jgi:hypothetical protein
MRYARCAFWAAAAVALASSGRARAEERIAVLEFTNRKMDPEFGEMLAERARHGALAATVGIDGYAVMTRENTLILTTQNGGACGEGECEVETGRLIGAALVLTGRVSLVERTFVVDLKLHETATGRLVGATSVEHREQLATAEGHPRCFAIDRGGRARQGASAAREARVLPGERLGRAAHHCRADRGRGDARARPVDDLARPRGDPSRRDRGGPAGPGAARARGLPPEETFGRRDPGGGLALVSGASTLLGRAEGAGAARERHGEVPVGHPRRRDGP